MQNSMITYSLIKSIYEESKDFLDIFVPFVLNSFPEGKKECNLDILSKCLEEKFGLLVPKHTLNTLIKRAARNLYVQRSQNKCFLTDKGADLILKTITKQEETKREINALFEDISNFIKENFSIDVNTEDIKELLNSFIKRQLGPLITFFNPKLFKEEWRGEGNKNEFYLIKYFKFAKQQKPSEFKYLEDIFYGALISSLVNKEDISALSKNFKKLQIFLDTNFMFSIMGLHYDYICKPAKELFELLRSNKFQLKIFNFTIDEMVRVLKGYIKEEQKYIPNIKVNSIYSNLKIKGWTRDDCIRYISKLEQRIHELGIQIEYTDIDLERWKPNNIDIFSRISEYKRDQNPLGKKHDLCAIEEIKRRRGIKPKKEIESCGSVFLTSDLKLAQFNFVEFGHKDNFTVCEVISDRILTTLLWLKKPSVIKHLPIETFMSIESEILIDRNIWNRFYDNLTKLKDEEYITEDDISILLYYHQLEQDLAFINDPDEITSRLVLEEIEKSKKTIDEKTKKMIEDEKKKLELKYKEEIKKKVEYLLTLIQTMKNNIKESSKKRTNQIILFLYIFLFLFFAIVIFLLWKKNNLIAIISLLVGILQLFGIKANIFKIRDKLTNKLFNKIYIKRLAKAKIEEFKDEISFECK